MTALLRTTVLGSAVLLLTGCPYMSLVPLSEPDSTLFMPELIGEWRMPQPGYRMWIARYDADEYFIILRLEGYCAGETRTHLSRVGDALFLNLPDEDDDGTYTIVRIELEADRLLVRVVGDILARVETSEELRSQLAARLDDPAIYDSAIEYVRTATPVTARGEDAMALRRLACPYEAPVPLGQPVPHTLDPRLLGSWFVELGDTTDSAALRDTTARITVQAFNDREYLITGSGLDAPVRGYLTRLGSALFINLQEVEFACPTDWMITDSRWRRGTRCAARQDPVNFSIGRVIFHGDQVAISMLNSGLHGAATPAQLAARVTARLDDSAIYWWETARLWRF